MVHGRRLGVLAEVDDDHTLQLAQLVGGDARRSPGMSRMVSSRSSASPPLGQRVPAEPARHTRFRAGWGKRRTSRAGTPWLERVLLERPRGDLDPLLVAYLARNSSGCHRPRRRAARPPSPSRRAGSTRRLEHARVQVRDAPAVLGRGLGDGVDDPRVVHAVDGDDVGGPPGPLPSPRRSPRRRARPARGSRPHARGRRAAPASMSSGAATISVIAKCPRRIVIWESSMLTPCSRSTRVTPATMPGRSRPDGGEGKRSHQADPGSALTRSR